MKIYLDFDGTCVESNYPSIGKYNANCFNVLGKLQNAKHEIVLNTYRIEAHNGTFEQAMEYLNNPLNKLQPVTAFTQTKIIAPEFNLSEMIHNKTIFIDDLSRGIPLKLGTEKPDTTVVDWFELNKLFIQHKIY